MTNPVLVDVTRGPLVESRHRGSLVLCHADGSLLLSLGDAMRPVFPRSAIKALQALPMVECGAADAFGFGEGEIALACASHTGTPRHVALVQRMLASAALDMEALGCGSHAPSDPEAARQLVHNGASPLPLHNNCSGKHAGMLATAVHMDEPIKGYWSPDHPVQLRIARVLEDFTGLSFGPNVCGVDGCSAPNWALPLTAMARAFARFTSGAGLTPARAADCRRIWRACVAQPELTSGPNRASALMMSGLAGRAYVKSGAEGVFVAAVPERSLGIALKIDDGAQRAAECVMAAVLARLFASDNRALIPFVNQTVTNWRGAEVGTVRPSAALVEALENRDRPAGTRAALDT